MSDLRQDEFRDRLDDAFQGRVCIQAWLGYGDCLFLGLSISGEPPVLRPGWIHGHCPYELRTELAEWSMRAGGLVLPIDESRAAAAAAAAQFVGQRTVGWEIGPATRELRVDFEHGRSLHIEPFDDEDTLEFPAWGVSFPDQMYLEVLCNGVVALLPYGRYHPPKT